MAWMDEYEWDFVKDSMDKKNIARSASHTRTHCGKGGAVKFPSDYLSKKTPPIMREIDIQEDENYENETFACGIDVIIPVVICIVYCWKLY